MNFENILKSKITTVVTTCVLIVVMVITARLMSQKREVDKEIKQLQAKGDEINRKNLELEEFAKYLDTPEYAERQAREKLNLKKEGEVVVGLPSATQLDAVNGEGQNTESNLDKWINHFFGQTS